MTSRHNDLKSDAEMKGARATTNKWTPSEIPRRRSVRLARILAAGALGVVVCLTPALAGCADQNVEAQAALDSASAHLAKDNIVYEQEMEQTQAWREAYIAAMGPPGSSEGMAQTVTFLEAAEQAIDRRLVELDAAKVNLDSIAGLDADPILMDQARLLGEIVDSELAYCDKHIQYLAEAKELSSGGFPPDEAALDSLEALRVELAELADTIAANYEAAAEYVSEASE